MSEVTAQGLSGVAETLLITLWYDLDLPDVIALRRKLIGARSHWALKDSQDLERWSDGIRLLNERFPYQYPEPRLARAVRRNPFFARAIGAFHYQLQGGQHVREH